MSYGTLDAFHPREVTKDNLSPLNTVTNSGASLYQPVGGGEFPFSGFSVIFWSDGVFAPVPQNVLGRLYFNSFREKIAPVFNKSVGNLLNIRNHLLLQLDLECGNISEEYFDKEETKYLTDIEEIPLEALKKQVRILFDFTNLALDSEDISEILNCPVDDAEKALKSYLNEV
jgi:hypothetical protein